MVAVVCGAAFGLGVVLMARALVPARPPLSAELARLTLPPPLAPAPAGGGGLGRLGRPLAGAASALGLELASLRSDLRVMGGRLEQHLGTKVAAAALGPALVVAMAALVAAGGLGVPARAVVVGAPVLAGVWFFVPDLTLGLEAARRRRELRQVLADFCDLAAVVLAAGEGLNAALAYAAHMGGGWGAEELRQAMAGAVARRETPFSALERLGAELEVVELVELAAGVSIGESEGARVREALTARAASLRAHELARAEARAGSVTEGMAFPLGLLFMAFVVVMGYPALAQMLAGL